MVSFVSFGLHESAKIYIATYFRNDSAVNVELNLTEALRTLVVCLGRRREAPIKE